VVPEDFQKRRPEEGAFCGECAERGVLRHEELEVDPGTRGIRNVAAAIAGLPGDPSSLPKAVLDNKDCRFEPRIQFVAVGATLGVKNSDGFTHNARILGRGNQEFWNAIIAPGTESPTRPFVVAGTYTAICDVHPWMKATVIATKHPYCAITGADGIAVIDKVPAGQEWEVTLWHESLGTARAKIAVEAGKRASWPVTPRRFKAR
jgi:plastocyanin